MTTSRSMTLVLVVALLLQPIFPLMALSPVNRTRPVEAAPSVAESMSTARSLPLGVDAEVPSASNMVAANDRPYLPVIYKTEFPRPVVTSNSPASVLPMVSASQTITNGEDIAYLINAQQLGRTRNFSDASPAWASVSGNLTMGHIYDFILDPQNPYHVAWVVGDTGIWRTTNLNSDPPTWQHLQSMQ